MIASKGNNPQMAFSQVSELLWFSQVYPKSWVHEMVHEIVSIFHPLALRKIIGSVVNVSLPFPHGVFPHLSPGSLDLLLSLRGLRRSRALPPVSPDDPNGRWDSWRGATPWENHGFLKGDHPKWWPYLIQVLVKYDHLPILSKNVPYCIVYIQHTWDAHMNIYRYI